MPFLEFIIYAIMLCYQSVVVKSCTEVEVVFVIPHADAPTQGTTVWSPMIIVPHGRMLIVCRIREYTTFQYIRRVGRARSELDATKFHILCNESFLLGYLTLSTFIHILH